MTPIWARGVSIPPEPLLVEYPDVCPDEPRGFEASASRGGVVRGISLPSLFVCSCKLNLNFPPPHFDGGSSRNSPPLTLTRQSMVDGPRIPLDKKWSCVNCCTLYCLKPQFSSLPEGLSRREGLPPAVNVSMRLYMQDCICAHCFLAPFSRPKKQSSA